MKTFLEKLENVFEWLLWESRFVVIIAVIASLFSAFSVFYLATMDVFYLVSHVGHYSTTMVDVVARASFRSTTIAHVVEIVDGYLLATVLLIFSLGLYELFISPIDRATQSSAKTNVLLIHSLDDLKSRLAKVILMILIVKFFEHAIGINYDTPEALLYLAGGIALIGLALYLTHKSDGHGSTKTVEHGH